LKNKYYLLLAIVFFILIFSSTSVCASPAIMISDYNLTPEVFMPGDNGILSFTIYNAETTSTQTTATTSGSDTTTTVRTVGTNIQNIYLTRDGDGDDYIESSQNFEDIGYLAPGASLSVKMRVDCNQGMTEGLYFPIINVDLEATGHQDVAYPIPVKVSNLSVDLISSNIPSTVSISGSTEITLTAINNRNNTVNKVIVTPKDTSGIKFIPERVLIGDLDADSSQDVSFSIEPSELGNKNLTFEVNFSNGDNLHNNTISVPIEVVQTYDVSPVLYTVTSTIEKGSSSRIRLEVYNAKTEEISGVIVVPETDITISPSQYFIGSMDPDDVFSASFDVYSNGLEIGEEYDINFYVSFKQGENYYQTFPVTSNINVVKASQKQSGLDLFSTSIIVLLIVIILLILYYSRKKGRTSK